MYRVEAVYFCRGKEDRKVQFFYSTIQELADGLDTLREAQNYGDILVRRKETRYIPISSEEWNFIRELDND